MKKLACFFFTRGLFLSDRQKDCFHLNMLFQYGQLFEVHVYFVNAECFETFTENVVVYRALCVEGDLMGTHDFIHSTMSGSPFISLEKKL